MGYHDPMNAKEWRKQNNLTLEQLSAKIGYNKSYLSKVENGKKMPSGGLLIEYDRISKGAVLPSDFYTSTDHTQ